MSFERSAEGPSTAPSSEIAAQTALRLSTRRRLLALGGSWAAVVAVSACGGGQQVAVLPGGGGTGDVPPPPPAGVGPTTGDLPPAGGAFGAITQTQPLQLNGMSWTQAASANVLIDDTEESSAQVGMLARVMGGLNAGNASGLANDVLIRPAVRGPIDAIDAAGCTVNGLRISFNAQTTWAAGLALSALRVGDVLHVHGHANPVAAGGAQIVATRVLRSTQRASFGISLGVYRSPIGSTPGAAANTLSLNGISLSTASAVFASGQSVTLRDGALLLVAFERGSNGSRTATQISPVLPALLADSTVRIQGFAYADGATPDLRIADVPMDLPASVSRASVEGRLVIATGVYRAGRLQVSAVA